MAFVDPIDSSRCGDRPPQVRVSTRRGVGVGKRAMQPSKEVMPHPGVRMPCKIEKCSFTIARSWEKSGRGLRAESIARMADSGRDEGSGGFDSTGPS